MTHQLLLTNDDGIAAPGIAVLRAALEGLGEVATIAPDRNNSAVARSITIDRPLDLTPVTFGGSWTGLACSGTPSDCVRIGLLGVENPAPDLVVSGVNYGANLGADVTYSGTVGAALEGALRGLPGIAFSVEQREPRWLAQCVTVIRGIVTEVMARGLPPHTALSVNIPDRPLDDIRGIRPARLGGASCHDRVFLASRGDGAAARADGSGPVPAAAGLAADPFAGASEYFVPCDHPAVAEWADTDFDVVAGGYIAVTPLSYELLDVAALEDLAAWDLDLIRLAAAGR